MILALTTISTGAFQLLTCKSANRDQNRPLVADTEQADQGRVRDGGGEDSEPLRRRQELDRPERERQSDENQKDFVRRAVSKILRPAAAVNL